MKQKCCIDKNALKEVGQSAELLKVIAEENRLKILCILKSGEMCACDIADNIGIPQNLASHHLKALRNKGLIESRKEGLNVIYQINKKVISKFNSLVNNFLKTHEK